MTKNNSMKQVLDELVSIRQDVNVVQRKLVSMEAASLTSTETTRCRNRLNNSRTGNYGTLYTHPGPSSGLSTGSRDAPGGHAPSGGTSSMQQILDKATTHRHPLSPVGTTGNLASTLTVIHKLATENTRKPSADQTNANKNGTSEILVPIVSPHHIMKKNGASGILVIVGKPNANQPAISPASNGTNYGNGG